MAEILPLNEVGVSVTYFGAKGDGKTLNTAALQGAVDYCAAKGGGTVIVPEGVFLCGTVNLKSNITLRLMPGAVLKASPNLANYRPSGYTHAVFNKTLPLIYAIGESDISITGEGEIDLNDTAFIDYSTVRPFYMSDSELSDIQRQETAAQEGDRLTQPLFFHDCRRITVSVITLRNSPCWTLTFSACRTVRVRDIVINNNLRCPDSDGIHISSCKDALISGVSVSTGGDAIAVTGITNTGVICERIIISDCILRSRSSAVRIGRGASKVEGVIVSRINAYDCNRVIGIFANDDGYIENVTISDIILESKVYLGAWNGYGEPLFIRTEGTGAVMGISCSCFKGKCESGAVISGTKHSINDVTLENWNLRFKRNHNFDLLGNRIAIPKYFALPLSPDRLPWLFAEEIDGFCISRVTPSVSPGEFTKLSVEPMAKGVTYIN